MSDDNALAQRVILDELDDIEAERVEIRNKYQAYREEHREKIRLQIAALKGDFQRVLDGWEIMEDAELEDLAMKEDDANRRLDDLEAEMGRSR